MQIQDRFFATQDIVLKPLDFSQTKVIFDAVQRNSAYLAPFLPWVLRTKQQQDTHNFIQFVLSNPTMIAFVIYDKNDFVGMIDFHQINTLLAKAEIGYWLIEGAQKKGIITQSVRHLCDYGFHQLKLNRITLKMASYNRASIKVAQRLGFIYEGLERDGLVLSSGAFCDCEIYSMLKREWK
ncbi:GNAT family N-acetyltransferase [Pasteurellaceae bacterium TAE3-ERU1]|nr:GNAT family N-acetyltransferase [Pasteurellaceae bacterium TAE3-ERU1]